MLLLTVLLLVLDIALLLARLLRSARGQAALRYRPLRPLLAALVLLL
ncbi:MAG: hypothetical protein GAK43_00176 [Stenotrophomonas maltophilia]|nr:MAG: hypothetical protein GAK43_00176 [Stenotrophomonas maltophilia]